MKPSRRHFLGATASAASLIAFAVRKAPAQTYPARPVRLIVGFPAGSGPDIVARMIGQSLSERLGQTFVVEDRAGASSNLATADVAHAPPDGYMLLLLTTANAINATLYQKLDYSFLSDIAPVASIDHEPFVLEVNPSLPVTTLAEFITYAKANPGKITMASAGTGSAPHLFGQLFQTMTDVELVHVPYRGNPLPDLMSGQVQVFFSPIQASLQYIRDGKLRVLAATTAKRIEVLPDVPAIAELVPGYEAEGWLGIGAPKNTPADVIARIHNALNTALADGALQAKLANLGDVVFPSSTGEFAKLLTDETAKWAQVIRSANVKLE